MINLLSSKSQERKIQELEAQLNHIKGRIEKEREIVKPSQKDVNTPLPQLKTLYLWSSIARPFVARDRTYFIKIAFVLMTFILIAAFLQDLVLIIVLCALMFAIYVLGTVKPQVVEHEINTRGVKTLGTSYYWDKLDKFWFSLKDGYLVLNIDTKLRFPSRLIMIVNRGDEQVITKIMFDHLNYNDVDKQGWIDRRSDGAFLRLVNDESGYSLEEIENPTIKKQGRSKVRIPLKLQP